MLCKKSYYNPIISPRLTCLFKASAQQIAALINLGNPSYTPVLWQITLLSWAILAVCIFANTILFRMLPRIEAGFACLHVVAFIAFITVLWYANKWAFFFLWK